MRKKKYDVRFHPFLFFQTEMINQMMPMKDFGVVVEPGTTEFFHVAAEMIPASLDDYSGTLSEGFLWDIMEQEASASDLHRSAYIPSIEVAMMASRPYQACSLFSSPYAVEEEFDIYGKHRSHFSYEDITYDHLTPYIETLDAI